MTFGRSEELCAHLIHHSDENTAKLRTPSLGPRKYKRRRRYGHDLPHFPNIPSFMPSDKKLSDTDSEEEVKRKITKKKYKSRGKDNPGENLRTVVKTLDSVVDNINSLVHKSSLGKSKSDKLVRNKYKVVGNNKLITTDSKVPDGKVRMPNYNVGGFVRRTKPAAEGRARPRTKNVTSSTLAALKAVSSKSVVDQNAKSSVEMNRVRPRTKNVNYHNVHLGKLTPAVFPNNLKSKSNKKEVTSAASNQASSNSVDKSANASVPQSLKNMCGEDGLNGNFRCEMCSETFSRRSELLVHVSIHI
ncbi:hypothetical protein PR048_026092 [Dryococelus australis]|uniref:C2H2-type domain-containing protein n=1 Tax=Dryococelus australis TaxID=614101 RepID=A0ABQ9GKD1_9NEOP|nr:hypothetical protein PR048_026092 [Dryococelus australis]